MTSRNVPGSQRTSAAPLVYDRKIVGTRTLTTSPLPEQGLERLQRRRDSLRNAHCRRHRVQRLQPVAGVDDDRLGIRVELAGREQLAQDADRDAARRLG